ncbi:MAG: orotidine-5'-phosphate decarboxylase, partial [Spirochaetaceae bacterium]
MSPMSTFFDRLIDRYRRIDSLLCVGLDPRTQPGEPVATRIVDANRRIIDATIDTALCYKPNIAFYEQHGPEGLQALVDTIGLIGDVPVLLDAKRGDIGSTAEAYAAAVRAVGAGAVTVSPYMGSDSVLPFVDAGLAVFVLCKTSNPGSNEFQTLAAPDLPLYRAIAAAATAWSNECGLVVGATDRDAIAAIRAAHPDVWILAPGIGAQGATMRDTVAAGVRADGAGLLPVVARGISGAADPKKAAADLVDEYRRARDERASSIAGATAATVPEDATVTRLLDAILDT